MDPDKRRQNVKTLDGIADILQQYPEISCEVLGQSPNPNPNHNPNPNPNPNPNQVLGQTTKNSKAEPLLAEFDRLDPVRDVQEVMTMTHRLPADPSPPDLHR